MALIIRESQSQPAATASGNSPDLEYGREDLHSKKKRRRKKKDPNELKKPSTAYILFCAEFRRSLDAHVTFGKATKLVCLSFSFAVCCHALLQSERSRRCTVESDAMHHCTRCLTSSGYA